MSAGKDLQIKVLFQGDASGLPTRQVVSELGAVEAAGGRVSGVLGGIGPMATAALATATVAAVGVGVRALMDYADAAAHVERRVMEIGTLMGGLTKGQIRGMSDELGRLSIMTGQAIEPLAKAKYDIVSSGFSDAASSAMVLEASARLAVGGVADVGETGKVVTAILNAYGKSASDASDVTDDLFTIVGKGVTTIPELSAQLGQLTAVAAPAGVSLDEAGAALAALTLQGQSTAIATTSVSAAIMELSRPSTELSKALDKAGISSDNLIQSGHGLTGALQLLEQTSERTGIPINRLIQREEALRAIQPLLSTASRVYADDLLAMTDNAGAASEAFDQMKDSSAQLKDEATQAFETAKRKVGEAIIESDAYKEVLHDIKGLFVGLATDADNAGVAMINAANDSEKRWIEVGQTIRDAFGWAAKLWDLADKGDRWIASMDAKNPYQKLVRGIEERERLKTAKAGSPGDSVGNETMLMMANAAKANANEVTKATEAHRENRPAVSHSTAAQSAHSASVARSTEAQRQAAEGQRLTAQAVEQATEWYEKLTEEFPGLYDEIKKQDQALYNLALMVNQDKASLEDHKAAVINSAAALEDFKFKAAMAEEAANKGEGGQTTGFSKSVKDLSKAAAALTEAGSIIGGRIGGGISTVGGGLSYLGADTSGMTSAEQYTNTAQGYAAIVAGVGQMIGGSVGGAVTNIASMAAAGSAFGPVGTAVGAVVGLASSLIGGGQSAEEKQRLAQEEADRRAVYDYMRQSMQAGSASAALMAAGGYSYSGVGALRKDVYGSYLPTVRGKLIADRSYDGPKVLLEELQAIDEAAVTVHSFMTPESLRTIEEAKTRMEYTIATVGELGGVTEAYWATVSQTLTGMSADSVQQVLLDAIDNSSAADAGEAFIGKYEDGIKLAIRNMAVSQLVSDVMMPMLSPVLQTLSASLLAGDYSVSSMSAMLSQAMVIADELTPIITNLATAFGDAGVSGYTPTVNAGAYRTYAEYRAALAGVPGYAAGGVTEGGPVIVGEEDFEIIAPPAGSRVFSNSDSRAMLDNSRVVEQLQRMQDDQRAQMLALVNKVGSMEALIERWNRTGLLTRTN